MARTSDLRVFDGGLPATVGSDPGCDNPVNRLLFCKYGDLVGRAPNLRIAAEDGTIQSAFSLDAGSTMTVAAVQEQASASE